METVTFSAAEKAALAAALRQSRASALLWQGCPIVGEHPDAVAMRMDAARYAHAEAVLAVADLVEPEPGPERFAWIVEAGLNIGGGV